MKRFAIPSAAALLMVFAGCSSMQSAANTTDIELVLATPPSWGGCAATVRGMLTKMPGVAGAKVEAQNADIVVTFDPTITNADAVIDGLKAGGQPAKKKS
jgi:copper chaperone CopZ